MKKIIPAAVIAAALAAPASASASVYMSKHQAEAATRSYVRENYTPDGTIGTYCRPQGLDHGRPGYIYTRWVCAWADEYNCEGQLRITGARGSYYYAKVLRGQRCPS